MVFLNDIIDALEIQLEESLSFLNPETGRVETVSNDLLREAEEGVTERHLDLPAWQVEEWEIAKRIASSVEYRRLPTKYEVHEWAIMRDFAQTVEPNRIHEDLLSAVHGKGAFRTFRYSLQRHGLEAVWFAFRTRALRQIAVEWCAKNRISWYERESTERNHS